MAYTSIDDPSAYFHTQLFSGTGSSQSITNDANAGDLQPDWVWIKKRAGGTARNSILTDSTRGVTKCLSSALNDAEFTNTNGLTAFGTDGFTVGSYDSVNESSGTYVAWQWKANSGTTASNTDGTNITSTVQANTTAGFSIVTWTGTGTISDTVGHGLGVTPHVVLAKERGGTDWWHMRHESLGSTENLFLNETNASRNATGGDYGGNIDGLTSSVFGFSTNSGGNAVAVNDNTITNVAYCFTPIQGYSKFGSYTGNGNADGPFIYTGFKPAWVIVKEYGANTNDWNIYDSKRSVFNSMDDILEANLSDAEGTGRADIDFLSNGFKQRNTHADSNRNSGGFIYMAFAEHPFVSSEGVPTTAR
jgi:hypothetical protein